ncbi:PLP-dependent aminotransferase family protein [Petroclostridium sp. X23]|uniref:aminotransferase-like domain-containing protein n=1 Tax=Petroclostridium sp. X23 TaxID=3045146 RepID=UPI0024AD8EF2|nr:PLP-dependent aminotransferase family protein [Petroclostridium sp. X23]WHH60679.1 PLP-dependent aminotransferase family protein [Petroclostridium sp. X23]
MTTKFAKRMDHLKASETRELLKLTENAEVISLAGGLPAPELFPIEEIKQASIKVLEEEGMQALQYATTEGFTPLRQKIAQRMNTKTKTHLTHENILVTTGSQQGLDFSGKVFLDENDIVLCESPSYFAAINAFKAYGARFIEVPTDHEGMVIEELENILKTTAGIKFIYVIPDFQNPTGRTWSIARRKAFMHIINKYEMMVVEDNPYGELTFEGEMAPSLKSLDTKGLVVFLGTFSKIFCPGFRIGWVAAEKPILEKYVLVKQSADLHTSIIDQRKLNKFLEMFDIDLHIDKLKRVYKKRKDIAIHTMAQEFPENVHFNNPNGGLFTWVEMPEGMDSQDVLAKCLKNNVAFVPGDSFFPNGGKTNSFRLNYSNATEENLVEGIKRIAKVLKEY